MISNSNLIKQYNNLLKKSGVYFLKLKIPNSIKGYPIINLYQEIMVALEWEGSR